MTILDAFSPAELPWPVYPSFVVADLDPMGATRGKIKRESCYFLRGLVFFFRSSSKMQIDSCLYNSTMISWTSVRK